MNRWPPSLSYRVHVLVEAQLQLLQEELARYKAVVPHLDDVGVVDGITQLCQCHVQFVHSDKNQNQTYLAVSRPKCILHLTVTVYIANL